MIDCISIETCSDILKQLLLFQNFKYILKNATVFVIIYSQNVCEYKFSEKSLKSKNRFLDLQNELCSCHA